MLSDSGTAYLALLALFASTLGLSAALRRRPGQTARDRRWAGAHALASMGGMALVVCAVAPSPWSALLAQALCLGAQLRLLQSMTTAHLHVPPLHVALAHSRSLQRAIAAVVLLLAIIAMLGDAEDAVRAIASIGHAATAAIVWLGLWLLMRERRTRAGFGHSLASVAACAQLFAQCLFLAMVLSAGSAGTSYPLHPEAAGLLGQAPLLLMLIALLAGIVGHTLLCAERLVAEQQARARLDPLTGLLHRGALEDTALRLAARAAREGQPLCCLVIDVDRFKQVNDGAGHLAGDAVLRHVADVVRRASRSTDVAARFGGEEFCLLCPRTSAEEATLLAERIRARIAAIALPPALGGHASVSIGIAQAQPCGDSRQTWEQLFAQADRALYRAKRAGRNRVMRAGADDMPVGQEPWHPACVPVGG